MIEGYYRDAFRSDLGGFFEGTRVPYFGHAWSHNCGNQINRVPAENRAAFLICLYSTVLVDQAMHAHFRQHYREFSNLTNYPKFCHGLAHFHHNPRAILSVPVERGVVAEQEVKDLLPAGMALLVDEVVDFFQQHMPQIDPSDFFSALVYDPDVQILGISIAVNPDLANDVVCIAYEALYKAAERSGAR